MLLNLNSNMIEIIQRQVVDVKKGMFWSLPEHPLEKSSLMSDVFNVLRSCNAQGTSLMCLNLPTELHQQVGQYLFNNGWLVVPFSGFNKHFTPTRISDIRYSDDIAVFEKIGRTIDSATDILKGDVVIPSPIVYGYAISVKDWESYGNDDPSISNPNVNGLGLVSIPNKSILFRVLNRKLGWGFKEDVVPGGHLLGALLSHELTPFCVIRWERMYRKMIARFDSGKTVPLNERLLWVEENTSDYARSRILWHNYAENAAVVKLLKLFSVLKIVKVNESILEQTFEANERLKEFESYAQKDPTVERYGVLGPFRSLALNSHINVFFCRSVASLKQFTPFSSPVPHFADNGKAYTLSFPEPLWDGNTLVSFDSLGLVALSSIGRIFRFYISEKRAFPKMFFSDREWHIYCSKKFIRTLYHTNKYSFIWSIFSRLTAFERVAGGPFLLPYCPLCELWAITVGYPLTIV